MRMDTDCEVLFFVSSSGHCTLECPYCIIDPIAKKEPSLNSRDMTFLLDYFQKKAFLAFSGKGDFFAGYKGSERFLEQILKRDVEIGLDINGVLIHEFAELPEEHIGKIRYVNLTMHYQQLKKMNLLNVWAKNARILIDKKSDEMLLGTIFSSALKNCWEESLCFYEKEIFQETGKTLTMIKDINASFNNGDEALLLSLRKKFTDMAVSIHQEDFSKIFPEGTAVLCPAGKAYFRIWNNGDVQGCPMIPALSRLGNLKEREISVKEDFFPCRQPMYCDCNIIEGLGKMRR